MTTKADDLLRCSVMFKGKATEIVKDYDSLNSLNETLIQNSEEDLSKFEIQDKARLKGYYKILMLAYLN